MIVVADASVLVAELLRVRGRALLAHPDLHVVVAEQQWDETQHQLKRRLGQIVAQGRLNAVQADELLEAVTGLIEARVLELVPRAVYEHLKPIARRRVPRDADDWQPVARTRPRRRHPDRRPRLPRLRLSHLDCRNPARGTRQPVTGVIVADARSFARGAFDWVGSVAVDADRGLGWLEGGELFDDLYSGTAGVLLGCAEAAASGLDTAKVSDGAVARLIQLIIHGPDVPTMPDDGLFSGWAGVAVALRAWSGVANDPEAATAAALVTLQIAERILHTPDDPARYTDVISGDAGTLLALLADDQDRSVAAANLLADRLVGRAEPGPDGLQWRMFAGQEYLAPGFSHGTAGVAYALAAAGRRLNRLDLVGVAVRGAEALLALGHTPEGWALPLVIPPQSHRPRVNYGWCHGPTGTVRLFLMLNAIDPQPRWLQAVDACMQALRDSRLPARLYPGFWDNLARCCGTAGVGQLLLDRYQATGHPDLLDWADVLAADVVDRAVITPDGPTWSNTEHTRTPPELPPEPGFMQGAAGIAGWLARLHALHTDRDTPPVPTGIEPSWL